MSQGAQVIYKDVEEIKNDNRNNAGEEMMAHMLVFYVKGRDQRVNRWLKGAVAGVQSKDMHSKEVFFFNCGKFT